MACEDDIVQIFNLISDINDDRKILAKKFAEERNIPVEIASAIISLRGTQDWTLQEENRLLSCYS
jgi:hypothetical protein